MCSHYNGATLTIVLLCPQSSTIKPCSFLPHDAAFLFMIQVRADANSAVGVSLDLSSRNESTSILVAEDIATFTRKKLNHKYGSYVQADKMEPHAPDNQDWVLYRATVQSSANYTITGINIVCTLKIAGEIGPEPEEGGILEAIVEGSLPYHASVGSISIRKTGKDTKFPTAELWVTEGEYISLSNSSNASNGLSLKISWKLKTPGQTLFKKYNIYVEMLRTDSSAKLPRIYLGVASVEAFYVSDLEVPTEVTGLKFIIQACGPDGSFQELEECPRFFIVPIDYEV
jgi:mannosyl-glycoprotein endo-beta-N-acetylglucosaminidase